ncbi:hypothetical protein GUITHDRAFT_151788 [Guillardia theta CCMP2712]|uniref:Nudix hydrolase domain-containing protein n=1 Tax=Guillardia theta (strain CCMP2712) TaxID=905079 RepID=L1JKA1_GUITC|nr:hypothetical protein GUITHDRAFT_151788 [Guillardia theta CCMP2712]EKX48584.1 hypothetical protein GUITHDRAFT_151788 [Guillardia theta CCMP2712]|eukprot:XP_005835564.1 hypothetical protein GUITHDRAFT_151788 [Guillardia theta CCMP2712]
MRWLLFLMLARTTQAFAPALRSIPIHLVASKSSVTLRSAFRTRALSMAAPGQDLSELFDVYKPPSSIPGFRGEPERAGISRQRKLVHTQGDWHRAIHIWLYDGQGNLIIQQRSEGKDTFPGKWDVSIAGHVSSGDSVIETAMKESKEELGLDIKKEELEYLGTIATSMAGSSPITGDFLCNEYKDIFLLKYEGHLDDLKFAPEEVQAVSRVDWRSLRQQLEEQIGPDGQSIDGRYIPRPRHYMDLLFGALEERIGK